MSTTADIILVMLKRYGDLLSLVRMVSHRFNTNKNSICNSAIKLPSVTYNKLKNFISALSMFFTVKMKRKNERGHEVS